MSSVRFRPSTNHSPPIFLCTTEEYRLKKYIPWLRQLVLHLAFHPGRWRGKRIWHPRIPERSSPLIPPLQLEEMDSSAAPWQKWSLLFIAHPRQFLRSVLLFLGRGAALCSTLLSGERKRASSEGLFENPRKRVSRWRLRFKIRPGCPAPLSPYTARARIYSYSRSLR